MVKFRFEDISHALQESIASLTGCLCQTQASLKLNGRTFKIVKLLGEGGFSYVYLAQDPSSGRLYALKKIRCPLGADSVREAMKEVEAYRKFRHPNIIRCLDSCVVQDKDGDGKVVYLFLPYYSRGNLQDLVNLHTNMSPLPEREILTYFLGTAKAVQAMHRYIPKKTSEQQQTQNADLYPPTSAAAMGNLSQPSPTVDSVSGDRKGKGRQNEDEEEEEEEEEEEGIIVEEDNQKAPLMGNQASNATVNEDSLGAEHSNPLSAENNTSNVPRGAIEPWAHRDLKPANVMISDDGEPILMDFGSAVRARVEISNRSIALQQQDLAAEHSSMPYRAPELFDVKTGETLTESVDIWSMGCLLYCLAYGHSPFETTDTVEQGGSVALAVMNGSWKFPNKDTRGYSDQLRNLIKEMLVLDPKSRPTIENVIDLVQKALNSLSD
ncbi:NAK protein kinase [Phakopsora pachyrhizi]|uniref:non-specific serine/threonine protein kinase n=1 Tax=Phakopsora pachyrhizi TaxID=170000 RepID=A0AAV0AGF8_PHAPC|nr:NAK protein kinase [Phakopsora pachyrhizi]CAH7666623.1 NAK protein kinase [Phakopsora pachyrhizi]